MPLDVDAITRRREESRVADACPGASVSEQRNRAESLGKNLRHGVLDLLEQVFGSEPLAVEESPPHAGTPHDAAGRPLHNLGRG